jgi:hypothetical protein
VFKLPILVKLRLTVKDHGLGVDDLLVERIMAAIDHPHMDFAPDLEHITSNMQQLATILISRAGMNGPYELCSRSVSIASDTWRIYENKRLENMAIAEEGERKSKALFTSGIMSTLTLLDASRLASHPVPPKPAPSEMDFDPRLVNALPGQYTSPLLPDTLTVAEDQYLRQYNERLKDYRQRAAALPSLQQQLYHAAASALPRQPTYKIPGRGWTYGDDPMYSSSPRSTVPMYVQDLRQRHGAPPAQAHPSLNGGMIDVHLKQVAFPNMYQHPASMTTMPQVASMPLPTQAQSRNALASHSFPSDYQQTQQMLPQPMRQNVSAQYVPYVPQRMPIAPALAKGSGIQVADIAHLCGTDWSNVMTQRARETAAKLNKSEKVERILHLHRTQHYPDSYLQMSPPKREAVPTRPLSSPAANMTPQPQRSMQQIEIPAPGAVGIGREFANHTDFFNVRGAFPSIQYGGLMEATKSLAEQDVKNLQFSVDYKRH